MFKSWIVCFKKIRQTFHMKVQVSCKNQVAYPCNRNLVKVCWICSLEFEIRSGKCEVCDSRGLLCNKYAACPMSISILDICVLKENYHVSVFLKILDFTVVLHSILFTATSSSLWFSWGPTQMQCRLCAACWNYWKKFGGLKMPTRLGKWKQLTYLLIKYKLSD